ncbi:MAG: hypothetical protein GY799_19105, partial [Desulfobulbaceae bacterium]|nr:hypothetical protein [Desulfobulbaceae bacterium]
MKNQEFLADSRFKRERKRVEGLQEVVWGKLILSGSAHTQSRSSSEVLDDRENNDFGSPDRKSSIFGDKAEKPGKAQHAWLKSAACFDDMVLGTLSKSSNGATPIWASLISSLDNSIGSVEDGLELIPESQAGCIPIKEVPSRQTGQPEIKISTSCQTSVNGGIGLMSSLASGNKTSCSIKSVPCNSVLKQQSEGDNFGYMPEESI